jgi:serine/threonine-protein kinase
MAVDLLLDRLQNAIADRYTIVRELGRGGMATVYLAQDIRNSRQVAVKVLGPELASAIGTGRFNRENEIAAP